MSFAHFLLYLIIQVTGYPEVYRLVYYGGVDHSIRKEVNRSVEIVKELRRNVH